MTETEILKILFPPSGAIPLDRINILPQIRSHISTIITLATGSHPDTEESRAITLKIVELREAGAGSWTEIAKQMGLGMTGSACRHRYTKYVKAHPVVEYQENAREDHAYYQTLEKNYPQHGMDISSPLIMDTEVPTIRKSRTVEDDILRGCNHRLDFSGEFSTIKGVVLGPEKSTPDEHPKQEKKPSAPLDTETLAEIDRLLGEGVSVMDITAELDKKGKPVSWARIRSRAAYLARMKKVTSPEPEEEEPRDRPEPVSISRKELDLRMWDMHRAGKTVDEISEVLYSEGLYYSPNSVRTRLRAQGAEV